MIWIKGLIQRKVHLLFISIEKDGDDHDKTQDPERVVPSSPEDRP